MRVKILFLIFSLILFGCEAKDRDLQPHTRVWGPDSGTFLTDSVSIPQHPYEVETLDFDTFISEREAHEILVKWIDGHPNRRVISVVSFCRQYGCGGISFITTSN